MRLSLTGGGVWLLRCLRPPSRALAFSCPTEGGKARGSVPVPAQQTIATVTASSTPGTLGTTFTNVRTWETRHQPVLGLGCLSLFHPAAITTLYTEVSCVSIGHRSRTVHRAWLTEAVLGFERGTSGRWSRRLHYVVSCGDGRARCSPPAPQPWNLPLTGTSNVGPLYPFSSFLSVLKERQSVPWAMSFCGCS